MSVNEELKQLADQFADKKINRRQLWKGAAGLGLSAAWIAALEKGALAGPSPLHSDLRAMNANQSTTLIIAVAENVDTFDPAFTVGSKTSQTVIQNTWDQLTQYQVVDAKAPDGTAYKTVDTEKIVGMLASDWKADGSDLVFTVRDGATYSNGDPIDAKVIEAGYHRVFTVNGLTLSLLEMGGATTGPADFVADDAKTFRIKMTKPNTLISKNIVMHNTSAVDPVELASKPDAANGATDYYRKNLGVGNGPYKLDSYKPDDSVVLVTNDKYYGTKPFFTKVILKIVADANQRVSLLKKGDVDGATQIAIKEYTDLKATDGVQSLSIPSNLVEMIELNTKVAPFDKKEVRQAVAYATPYQDIITQVYLDQAGPAKSLVPTGMPTSDGSTNQYTLDLDKAKALLATAGYPGGAGLPEIKLTISADNPQRESYAIVLKDSLSKIGMNVSIEKLPYAQYNQLEQSSQLQIWSDQWISWVNDPYYHLSWLAQSASPTNYPKIKSDRIDALIAQYTLAPSSPERDAASKEMQAILIEECPYIFLCQPNWIIYFRKDIQGYVYYNDELPRYYELARAAS